MLFNPSIQRKAQQAVDSVLQGERLPDFSDRPALPYIDAVVKEVFRYQLVTPLGEMYRLFFGRTLEMLTKGTAVPHALIQEDVYKGYRLPAGSIVVGNGWSVSLSPTFIPLTL
jgi:hypothetical protein